MYKVILVDDDYPVLEFLSEAIDWEQLGLTLQGVFENGLNAWEHAQIEMPDILITDIGMPKMDGLELIRRMKEKKPNLRAGILSCHSEFHYAQQALKLHVQDYLLKETLDPEDLQKLLAQFVESLLAEQSIQVQQTKLQHIVDRNKEIMKDKFFSNTIQQPILDMDQWKAEAETFGLHLNRSAYLPVIGFINSYRPALQRFVSGDILQFAIDNVMEEMIRSEAPLSVHFAYGTKESFYLHPVAPGLKVNGYDEAANLLQRVQTALKKSLKINVSFMIGDIYHQPHELKQGLIRLIANTDQRFYMEESAIVKYREVTFGQEDLFSWYDQACEQFRTLMMEKDKDAVIPTVSYWIALLQQHRFAPDTIKDWVLKLLLDLKLKLQSMQQFRSIYTVDIMHQEIVEIDSLAELKHWLIDYFHSVLSVVGDILDSSKRSEVMDARQYVSMHLNKRISLEEVAEHLHLNPSYFSRLFKKETGETFIEFVTRLKISRAKELLDQTNQSAGKICELLGYDNQSYFIKLFKANVGVTPIEYRNSKSNHTSTK
jgi:two-component system response regulator YesN